MITIEQGAFDEKVPYKLMNIKEINKISSFTIGTTFILLGAWNKKNMSTQETKKKSRKNYIYGRHNKVVPIFGIGETDS